MPDYLPVTSPTVKQASVWEPEEDTFAEVSQAQDKASVSSPGMIVVPPGDPYFANVGYLLNFNDASGDQTPYDPIVGNNWTSSPVSATVQSVSHLDPKFGVGAWRTDSSNDCRLECSVVANTMPGGIFTLEGFVKFPSGCNTGITIGNTFHNAGFVDTNLHLDISRETSPGRIHVRLNFPRGNGVDAQPSVTLLDVIVGSIPYVGFNEYTHIAGSYDGTTLRLFVAGIIVASAVVLPRTLAFNTYRVGKQESPLVQEVVYLDACRFTYGVCRYTEPFTPPDIEFYDFAL